MPSTYCNLGEHIKKESLTHHIFYVKLSAAWDNVDFNTELHKLENASLVHTPIKSPAVQERALIVELKSRNPCVPFVPDTKVLLTDAHNFLLCPRVFIICPLHLYQ